MNNFYSKLHSDGFTMIEILVSIIVIAVGLLGIAGIQLKAQQAGVEALQRVHALILIKDMVNRINVNRNVAGCYNITDPGTGMPFAGYGNTTTFNCAAFGVVATRAVADADLADWDNLLKGQAEQASGGNVGAMIGARGCISYDVANDFYTVSVAWQGLTETAVPANNCAINLYGSEARRRVVSVTLRIADLD